MLKRIRGKIKEWNERSIRMQEAALEDLCEHLKLMGLNVSVVKFKRNLGLGQWPHSGIIGAAKVAGRKIDLVELEEIQVDHGTSDAPMIELYYRCNYLVRLKVQGLEDWLRVESKPVRKGILNREIVDVKWEEKAVNGKDLAQVLNNDPDLKRYFLSRDRPPNVEVETHVKHQCVRIWHKHTRAGPPQVAFPTLEDFEAYDRIASHVRSAFFKTVGELIKGFNEKRFVKRTIWQSLTTSKKPNVTQREHQPSHRESASSLTFAS